MRQAAAGSHDRVLCTGNTRTDPFYNSSRYVLFLLTSSWRKIQNLQRIMESRVGGGGEIRRDLARCIYTEHILYSVWARPRDRRCVDREQLLFGIILLKWCLCVRKSRSCQYSRSFHRSSSSFCSRQTQQHNNARVSKACLLHAVFNKRNAKFRKKLRRTRTVVFNPVSNVLIKSLTKKNKNFPCFQNTYYWYFMQNIGYTQNERILPDGLTNLLDSRKILKVFLKNCLN